MKINLKNRIISLLLASGIFFTGVSLTGCVKKSNDSVSIKIEEGNNNESLINYSRELAKKLSKYNISEQEILVFISMNKDLLNQDIDFVAKKILEFMAENLNDLSPKNDSLNKIYLEITKSGYNITMNQLIEIINCNPFLVNQSLSKTIDNIKVFIDNEYTVGMDLNLLADKLKKELSKRKIYIEKDFILSTIILMPDIVKDTIYKTADEFESYIKQKKFKK